MNETHININASENRVMNFKSHGLLINYPLKVTWISTIGKKYKYYYKQILGTDGSYKIMSKPEIILWRIKYYWSQKNFLYKLYKKTNFLETKLVKKRIIELLRKHKKLSLDQISDMFKTKNEEQVNIIIERLLKSGVIKNTEAFYYELTSPENKSLNTTSE